MIFIKEDDSTSDKQVEMLSIEYIFTTELVRYH